MIAIRSYVLLVIGVMSIRQIMRFEFVIGAMLSIANGVMRWISVRIVGRWFVVDAAHFVAVNSVDVDCVRIVPRLVDGESIRFDIICIV
jgi:hypothetical protein